MPRPLEFDRTHALEAAMKLFWERGYTATSLADLLEAMTISRSSFYASFVDKPHLFAECLDLFAQRTRALLEDDESPPAATIRHFFTHTLIEVPARRTQRGCLLVNSVLELADVDDDLQARARAGLDDMQRRFEILFSRAIDNGDIETAHSPAQLAELVMTINQGLRVQSRKRLPRKQLHAAVETSLSLLGLAA